jgi:hypothetical protein
MSSNRQVCAETKPMPHRDTISSSSFCFVRLRETNVISGGAIMKWQSIFVLAIVFFLTTTGTVFADLHNGLVGYYPFNNGDASDMSGSGHDGTVYGASLTTDRFGNLNSAYSFDGDDYISLSNPSDFMFSGSFSVSLWTFVASNTSYDPFIWLGGSSIGTPDFTLSKSRSGYVNGRLYAQAIMGSSPPSPWVTSTQTGDEVLNRWIHLVGIVDQGTNTLSFYVDNVLQGTTSLGSFDLSSVVTPGVNIGRDTWGWDYHYGLIDDVRIYNRALTRSEVTELNLVPIPSAVILGGLGLAVASWRLRGMKRTYKEGA